MARCVADASVVAKWFLEEEHSDAALRLRDDHAADLIQVEAPSLMPYEVLNAVRYAGFSLEELKELAVGLESLAIPLHPVRGQVANATLEVAHSADITVYDATYAGLALVLHVPMYSADSRLLQALTGVVEGVHIRDYRTLEG